MNRFWDGVLRDIIEVAQPRKLVEVGVAAGLLTEKLLDYCTASGAVLHAIDPKPQIDVDEWQARYGERLVFRQALSLEVLGGLHHLDAVFLDGDHNWFTLYHELRLLEEVAVKDSGPPPLLVLHDLDWPYGRRDLYYDPATIPNAYRHPYRMLGMYPGESELVEHGMNSDLNNAVSEGTPKNGVRTALEDFVGQSELHWQLFHVPGFNGLGIAATDDRLSDNKALGQALESLRTARFLEPWGEHLELTRVQAEIDDARRISFAHDQQSFLEDERDRLEHERDQLRVEAERRNARLVEAERRLAGVPDLKLRITDLERELEDARVAAAGAQNQISGLDERVTRGQQVLTDVLSSPSWRVTKPLRKAKHMLSRD